MGQINIRHTHAVGAAQARVRLEKMQQSLATKYGVTVTWNGNVAEIKGTGVNGKIEYDEFQVHVLLSVSFPATMVEGRIRNGIKDALQETFP